MSRNRKRYPPSVKFIIGNEGCERFSFYGMKNILTFFMIHNLGLSKSSASASYHLFVSAVYFFPLLGGYLADRFLGKYRTIFWLSLLYCLGHGCLALFDRNPTGFAVGLGLIALGSGGIKPCVSSFVGDQFDSDNREGAKHIFALFYWIINFGSFSATLFIPKMLEWFGPQVAFGIPGILMAISTIVLWSGRNTYVNVPPTGRNPHSFLRVVRDAWRSRRGRQGQGHFLDAALGRHPQSAVEGAKAVLRIVLIFLPIPAFWALWDQKGSTWIVQATQMDLAVGPWHLAPSQLMALNPLLVMLMIPLSTYVVYPAVERAGFALTPLRRMTIGMFVTGSAFVAVGLLQFVLDGGTKISILWQALPYLLVTLGEVLVSTTGLEFAYAQAPLEMKGTLMSVWNLTVTVGNLLTAGISALNVFSGGAQYLFFALLVAVAAAVFGLLARRYVSVEHFRAAPEPELPAGRVVR